MKLRYPRVFKVGLPVLIVLAAANHVENHLRYSKWAPKKPRNAIAVQAEAGPIGCATIGVNEQATTLENAPFLRFYTLMDWEYDAQKPAPAPEAVMAWHQKPASCIGFMYPLMSGDRIQAFCLLRTTQTCCYGPKPQFNQFIFVETKTPVPFERFTPVVASGRFFVEERPQDGYIYRMEAVDVRSTPNEVPDADPVAASKQTGLPLLDFALIRTCEKQNQLPPEQAALAGKTVIVSGMIYQRTPDVPPRLVFGPLWTAKGKPKYNCFDSVIVTPRDAGQVPPPWKVETVFTGKLRLNADSASWQHKGIVFVDDAIWGVPGINAPPPGWADGPVIPVTAELYTLLIFLLIVFG